jgi:FdhD protein
MHMPASPADAPTTVRLNRDLWLGSDTKRTQDVDFLSREEPLEIRVGTVPVAVLMRTPGHDLDLVTGFALTEGLFKSLQEIRTIVACEQAPNNFEAPHDSKRLGSEEQLGSEGRRDPEEQPHDDDSTNVMRIVPQDNVDLDAQMFKRSFYSTSSCGICGKRSIEIAMKTASPLENSPVFRAAALAAAPYTLRQHQSDFDKTGALHAAGLIKQNGELLVIREDIGRHNAVDKVIGWALRHGQHLEEHALIVSGRISFEIVQKALFARISCLVGVGGVSSLAVELAEQSGMAIVGFARKDRLSIYSGAERVK